jgi:hypothetical protein
MEFLMEQFVVSSLNRPEVLKLSLSNEVRETLRRAFMQQASDICRPEFTIGGPSIDGDLADDADRLVDHIANYIFRDDLDAFETEAKNNHG